MRAKLAPMVKKLGAFLIRHHWWVMAFLGAILILKEAFDHYDPGDPTWWRMEFLRDMLIYGLLMPAAGGLFFGWLQRVEAQRAEIETQAINERQNIARDLHDSLAQNIGYLRMKLDQLSQEATSAAMDGYRPEIEQMRAVADQSYLEVRELIATLHAPPVTDLWEAIQQMAHKVGERAHLELRCTSQGQPQLLPARVNYQALHICQEAVSNAVKHGQAGSLEIDAIWSERLLALTIHDDGAGFAPDQEPGADHYGLRIMRARAEDIAACLSIHSTPGHGTWVNLEIPVEA